MHLGLDSNVDLSVLFWGKKKKKLIYTSVNKTEMAEPNLIRKISDSLLGRFIILNKVFDSSYTKNCGKQKKLLRENL